MSQRIADLYAAQARRALEAGCGGRTIGDTPVDLEPTFEMMDTGSRWLSSVTRLLTFPRRRQSGTMFAADLSCLRLCIAGEDDTTPASAEQLLIGLGKTGGPVAFEIVGHNERTTLQLICGEAERVTLEGIFSVQFPNSQIVATPEDILAQAIAEKDFVLGEYDLDRSCAYMLKVFTSFKGADPLSVALGVLEELPAGGFGAIQILFRQVGDEWRSLLRRAAADPFDESLSSQRDQKDLVTCAEKKVVTPFFAVIVRLIGSEVSTVKRLEGFLDLFSSAENRLIRARKQHTHPKERSREITLGRLTYRHGMLLNVSELAGLVHLPSASVSAEKLQRVGVKTTSLSLPFRERKTGVVLGVNVHRGRQWEVRLTEDELIRHLYCAGISGTGKSTFLLNLLLQLIEAGYGVAVLDPHGDLVEQQILPRIPAHRRADVICLIQVMTSIQSPSTSWRLKVNMSANCSPKTWSRSSRGQPWDGGLG